MATQQELGIQRCSICQNSDVGIINSYGLKASHGDLTWAEAARQAGLTGGKPAMKLRKHMENHYVNVAATEVGEALDRMILEGVAALEEQFSMAPPEVKPLYAAAILNLRGLKDTKPSQQHLILALRTIQELTGMKSEQRILMAFAQRMFKEVGTGAQPAISAPDVIDVEVVEEVNTNGT